MDRVERAGELALKAGHYSPRYKQLEPIHRINQDKIDTGLSEQLNILNLLNTLENQILLKDIKMKLNSETKRKMREMKAEPLLDA